MKKPAKTTAKKAAPTKAKTNSKPHGFMWKILQQKDQRRKLHDQTQGEAHGKMHEFESKDGVHKSTGFSRFAGARRKAA